MCTFFSKLTVSSINLIILFILHRYHRLLLCYLDTILQGTVGAVTQNIAQVSQAINVQLAALQNSQLASIGTFLFVFNIR